MHRHTSYIHLVFIVSLFCSTASSQKLAGVRIQQDESWLLDSYGKSITLKKKSFKINVYLQKVEGVYVFASFQDSIYRLKPTDTIPGFKNLPHKVMAEEEFNKEKELLVSDGGWSYWFYDPALKWHRFNKKLTIIDTNRVVGFKSIKQLYCLPQGKEIKLKENDKTLYLFFVVVAETDDTGSPGKELSRYKVKIDWTNDD